MNKQCQSCGMPLQNELTGDCRGSEINGAKSEKWCKLCYVNGAFVDPDCTLQEMQEIVDQALKEQGSGKIMRSAAKHQIPTLERWKVGN